jgi:hypothetical protein
MDDNDGYISIGEDDSTIMITFFYGMFRIFILIIFLNVLSYIQRKTRKNILRSIRVKYYRIKPNSTTGERFETIRESIDDYLKYLERGDITAFETIMYGWYTTNVSEENRRRFKSQQPEENKEEEKDQNNNNTKMIYLPVWMEKLIDLYNNPWIFNMALMIVFFIFALVWYPIFAYTLQSETISRHHQDIIFHSREEIISNLIGDNISHCDSLLQANSGYCFTDADLDRDTDTDNMDMDTYHRKTQSDKILFRTIYHLRQPFITTWNPADLSTHHVLRTTGNVNIIIPVVAVVVTGVDKGDFAATTFTTNNTEIEKIDVESLVDALKALKVGEEKRVGSMQSGNCVCPIFLGIYGNITFHYNHYDDIWTIMRNPRVYRNNSLSTLVVSTVKYHYNSLFYDVNLQIRKRYDMDNLIHHNSFIVEYDNLPTYSSSSPQNLMDEKEDNNNKQTRKMMNSLSELNNRVKSLEKRPLILEKILEVERTTIQLIQDDAICFTYCDTLNRKTMKIN